MEKVRKASIIYRSIYDEGGKRYSGAYIINKESVYHIQGHI